MSDASGDVTIVFNGEIYNHALLRRELESAGVRFVTRNSDTEALLNGYLHWGADGLLTRLQGMFAFAIWDGRTGELIAARDRLGVKPLYYSIVDGTLVMASEIKAIAAHPGFSVAMNEIACRDILEVLATPCPQTIFDGVFKVAPGETLSVNRDGALKKKRYWRMPDTPDDGGPSAEDAAIEIERLARRAVEARLAEEVEGCVLLSGGVDSSFVLGAAAQAGKRMRAFTAAFAGDPMNEAKEAAAVAAHFGCEHEIVEIEESKAMAALGSLMADMDEPIADWACIPLQFLSVAVHARGIKVGLVGEGADELFSGYPAWNGFIDESMIWKSLARIGRSGEGAGKFAAALARRAPLSRMGLIGALDVAASVAMRRGRFRSGAEALRPLQVERLLRQGALERPGATDPAGSAVENDLDTRLDRLGAGFPDSAATPAHRFVNMRRRDISFRLPELLLMRVDKITMGSSLEARVPFLDHHLVEYVAKLPAATVLAGGGGKPLLKRALGKILPAEVLQRPKVGLGAPMARWMRSGLRHEISEILAAEAADPSSPFNPSAVRAMFDRHASGAKDYAQYLLPIINIALWRRRWLQ
jgi:asparagine synthase (glutamine-hydrolysing)